MWRGLYFRFENGIHTRESGDEYLLTIHNHASSLEDHAKLLVKRLNSIGHQVPGIVTNKTSDINQKSTTQPKNNCDNDKISRDESTNKTLIENLDGNEDDKIKAKALIDQIEIELKTVAIDWKSSSKIDECSCSITFDAFNKRVKN